MPEIKGIFPSPHQNHDQHFQRSKLTATQ